MRLFLVRHGESVDNVAGLKAGSRDASLTSHGVLQARRLGSHLATRAPEIGPIRHLFASDLQRAYRTAEAIVEAQFIGGDDKAVGENSLHVVRVADLREKGFGSAEGQRWASKSLAGSGMKPVSDAESHDRMKIRAERFVREHLDPLVAVGDSDFGVRRSVVIVSHGIFLGILLSCLLSRWPSSVTDRGDAHGTGLKSTEYLVSWSNTGYLEAVFRPSQGKQSTVNRGKSGRSLLQSEHSISATAGPSMPQASSTCLELAMLHINCIAHLQGLKKTRGGIGSSQFDKKQKTMDSFFGPAAKKQKTSGGPSV